MTDDWLKLLKPCPFCGSGSTLFDESRLSPTMSGNSPLISVEIRHWCRPTPGQPTRHYICKMGRDYESAVAAWNRRVGEEA